MVPPLSWATPACNSRGACGAEIYTFQANLWWEPADDLAQQDCTQEPPGALCLGEEPRSGWLCLPLVSACFLLGGNQMNICEYFPACCICELTVAPAGWKVSGSRNIFPLTQTTPSDLSPKPLQELLPLPSECPEQEEERLQVLVSNPHSLELPIKYRSNSIC